MRLLRHYEATSSAPTASTAPARATPRAVYTFFYNLLIRRMFGVKARDINFAFKLCGATCLDSVDLRSEGSFIDAELIIRAIRSGFELLQFGVDYFPRTMGESTLSSPGVIQTIIKEMFSLRGDLNELKQPPRRLAGAPRRPELDTRAPAKSR